MPLSANPITWSSSPCWCWRTSWRPPCGSCCFEAGCFTPADPADLPSTQRKRLMTIAYDVAAVPPQTRPEPVDAPAVQLPWVRPALLALLVATAVLYLWGLGSSGWANDYYAAAAHAGTQDW